MRQDLFPIYPGRTADSGRVYSTVLGKHVTLTKPMLSLVRALNRFGYLDEIRDGGRVGTYVALMDRGILRGARKLRGMHMPATTPGQAWDDAHAEDARRTAEADAYLADSTRWVQATPDDDESDAHTRQTRDGQTLLITQRGFRYWHVYVGDTMELSASGDWAEVRTAADRFERNTAHGEALDEHAEEEAGWGQPDGMLGRTQAEISTEARHALNRELGRAFDTLAKAATPAEQRTGISDRAAAALVDVAELRASTSATATPDGETYAARNRAMAALDRIEQALRATNPTTEGS